MVEHAAPRRSLATQAIPEYQTLIAGDVLKWRFVAKAEHTCVARASLSLVFGSRAHVLADKVKLPGGPDEPGVFEGTYTITEEDVDGSMPFVRASLYAAGSISISLQHVDLSVVNAETAGPARLDAEATAEGIALTWSAGDNDRGYNIYRKPANGRRVDRRFLKAGG